MTTPHQRQHDRATFCLMLLCLALAGCVPRPTGGVATVTINNSRWQAPPGAQPAPASTQPIAYDYGGIARITIDGRQMGALEALAAVNARYALEVGQITPLPSPLPGRLRVVLPDHDRLRLLALQMHRGVQNGLVEMQTEMHRLGLHQTADAVLRSRVFQSVDIADENDTAAPEPAGADDVLWFQVQSMRPNNAGPWLGAWQIRRASGGATMAVSFDPGTPPGPPRLMSFIRSVRDAAGALGGGQVANAGGAPLAPRHGGHPYSSGSGIAIDSKGHVLTANHVIANCLDVRITGDGGGEPAGARLVANDAGLDLAVLQTDQRWSGHARFRSSLTLRPGEPVVVTGFPLSGIVSPEMAVTTGSVTALSGLQGNARLVQFSAPVQPGNSGGPVLDGAGRVVGVATMELNSMALAAATGTFAQNINFATKADVARDYLAPLQVRLDSTPGRDGLDAATIGDMARKFTLKVECWK